MRRVLAAAAAFAALLPAGCGSDDGESGGATTSGGSAQTVELKASEYAFDPSSPTVDAAGNVTFRVSNDGEQTHALEVEGNGVEEETGSIAPGDSGSLTVDLQPGTYEFYCPIDGHRDRGMEGTLVVGGSGAGAGTSTGTSTGTATDEGATTEDSGYGG